MPRTQKFVGLHYIKIQEESLAFEKAKLSKRAGQDDLGTAGVHFRLKLSWWNYESPMWSTRGHENN